MKFRVTYKFSHQGEKEWECPAWNPLLFISTFASQTAGHSFNEWERYPILEYYRVERVDD